MTMSAATCLVPLANGQTEFRIPSGTACTACRIRIDTIAMLGDVDGAGMVFEQSRISARRGGPFFVVSNFEPGIVKAFDGQGRFVGQFGRFGTGPGEFRNPWFVLPSADTIHVFDLFAPRVTALTRDFDVIEVKRLPFLPSDVVGSSGSGFAVAAAAATREHVGIPLHIYDYGRGEVVASFGSHSERVLRRGDWDQERRLGPSSDGTFWAGRVNRYRVERWSTAGELLVAYERDAEWFTPWTEVIGTARTHRPPPWLKALSEDDAGRLWVILHRPARDWRPLAPAVVRGGMTHTSDKQRNELFESVIEVLLPVDGRPRVYASRVLRGQLAGFVKPGIAYIYDEDEDGNPRYLILGLHIDM